MGTKAQRAAKKAARVFTRKQDPQNQELMIPCRKYIQVLFKIAVVIKVQTLIYIYKPILIHGLDKRACDN